MLVCSHHIQKTQHQVHDCCCVLAVLVRLKRRRRVVSRVCVYLAEVRAPAPVRLSCLPQHMLPQELDWYLPLQALHDHMSHPV